VPSRADAAAAYEASVAALAGHTVPDGTGRRECVGDEPVPEQPTPATLGGVRLLRFRRRKGSRRGVLMLNAR